METASENGNSAVASTGMIALFVVIGALAVLLFIVILVSCIRKQIRNKKRETVNMEAIEVSSTRFGAPLGRQRSISLIDINSHMEQRKKEIRKSGSEFSSSVHSRDSVDSIRFLPLSCEIPRQTIVDLDIESKQNRASSSIQKYMKSVGLVKDQVDVFEETEDEEEPRKGLKYKKTRPRSRSTDSQTKSQLFVHSISLSDSEDEKARHKGKSKLKRDADSDTDTHVSKSSKVSKSSRMSKKSVSKHKVESSDEDGSSSDSEHKLKKPKHDNNDNSVSQPPKKKRQHRTKKTSKRNLLQSSTSGGSTTTSDV